jgi:cytochrome c-type biogenesis protein CcmE
MNARRVVASGVVIAAALGWVASESLSGNLVYYKTPAEVMAAGSTQSGRPIRVGGLVLPGSVAPVGSVVRFTIAHEGARLAVKATEGVPSLFEAGRGVVVEGTYGKDGVFLADTVLVKHGSEYRPPSSGDQPRSADLEE